MSKRIGIVISLAVREHMSNVYASFAHIFEFMRSGGIIYLSLPNLLWPYEYHYRLGFLSWLHLALGNVYVRLSGRGTSFEDSSYMFSYVGLRHFLKQYPSSYEFIGPEPDTTYLGWGLSTSRLYSMIQSFGIKLFHSMRYSGFFPKHSSSSIRKNNVYEK